MGRWLGRFPPKEPIFKREKEDEWVALGGRSDDFQLRLETSEARLTEPARTKRKEKTDDCGKYLIVYCAGVLVGRRRSRRRDDALR